ncbi:hypothetical protein ZWY2020_033111 [Hordeum vulgare]|nr:hypothetical protein ZWY2020_033111 [Hordeum vulgare]
MHAYLRHPAAHTQPSGSFVSPEEQREEQIGTPDNIDEGGKDEYAENMQIEGMIMKDEDVNPESTKTIEQQAIMDDTENM